MTRSGSPPRVRVPLLVPLLAPLLALVAGILASPYVDPRPIWLCLPLAVLLAFAHRRYALIALFLLGAGLRARGPQFVPPLSSYVEASRVVGRIGQRPEWRGLGVYLDVDIQTIDGRAISGRARLTEFLDDPELYALFQQHDLATGDQVEIVVRLRRPTVYRNPGVFDYREHLERQGIFWTGTIRNPRLITVLERGPRWLRSWDRIQNAIDRRLGSFFTEDAKTKGLVMGMVLGRKHDLTSEVERDFQIGGLYHLVVVSGFNLAVVGGAAGLIARFVLKRRAARLAAVVAAIGAYALLVGLQPPVLRAAIMVLSLVAAKLLDRDYSSLNAIALVAFVLLIADPRALEDKSFQMTFLAAAAVTGIGLPAANWAMGDLREKLRALGNSEQDGFLPPSVADWRVARRMFCEVNRLPFVAITGPWRLYSMVIEALIVSLAVHMVFAVVMIESFHRFSAIAPVLNVPAALAAAAITPMGLLLLVLPDVFAQPVTWGIAGLVHGLLDLLKVSLSVPYASLSVPSVPAVVWLIYGVATGVTILAVHRRWRPGCALGVSAVVALQFFAVAADLSPGAPAAVTVTFLDVGQGDSTLIEFPDRRRVLIDGGGVAAGRFLGLRDESTFSIGEDVVSAYLFSRRIRYLDAVVLTHAHYDHMDGLFDVLDNFAVGELWLGRNPMIPAYRALIEKAQVRNVPLRWLSAGQEIGGFKVLHPPAHWRVKKSADNNDSVVLLLDVLTAAARSRTSPARTLPDVATASQGGSSHYPTSQMPVVYAPVSAGPRRAVAYRQTALFTGDLELPLPDVEFVNLLKVSHHGSKGVRMRVMSDVRVISVGATNSFGHPHVSSLPALRTDTLGAIEVRLEGDRPVVRFLQ